MAKSVVEKILVAVHNSEQSLQAALYAIMLAKQLHCDLEAVYIVDSATLKRLTLSKFFIAEESSTYEKALHEEGKKCLENVQSMASSKGVKIETKILSGCVWSEIVQEAERFKADFLILGGNKKKINGSSNIARYDVLSDNYKNILLNCRTNVLIVGEDDLEKRFKGV